VYQRAQRRPATASSEIIELPAVHGLHHYYLRSAA
jgi:hypothetical protein